MGWINDARRDLRFCLRKGRLREWPHALAIRWQQRRARLLGLSRWLEILPARQGDLVNPASTTTREPAPASTPVSTGPSSAPVARRFTLDGSDALEQHLESTCALVLAEVQSLIPPKQLDALVLGGGYGRGQGGVLKTDSGECPYNDLEFYVFMRGNRVWNERKFLPGLHALGERLSPAAGLHVEFKVDSFAHLRRGPVTMFSYDLVSRHRTLWGSEDQFKTCSVHLEAERIRVSEATRLLLNRCTGLLLAKELLDRGTLTSEQEDFIWRNLAKAKLALGDAILTAFRQYHWDCQERGQRLNRLPIESAWFAKVRDWHREGVEFKLRPHRISQPISAFREAHGEISAVAASIWLRLERWRLNHSFASLREYSLSPVRKCSPSAAWRNVLLNVRTFGLPAALDRCSLRYPRERLLNSLPLLLGNESMADLLVTQHLQKQLRSRAADWHSLVQSYKSVWAKFG